MSWRNSSEEESVDPLGLVSTPGTGLRPSVSPCRWWLRWEPCAGSYSFAPLCREHHSCTQCLPRPGLVLGGGCREAQTYSHCLRELTGTKGADRRWDTWAVPWARQGTGCRGRNEDQAALSWGVRRGLTDETSRSRHCRSQEEHSRQEEPQGRGPSRGGGDTWVRVWNGGQELGPEWPGPGRHLYTEDPGPPSRAASSHAHCPLSIHALTCSGSPRPSITKQTSGFFFFLKKARPPCPSPICPYYVAPPFTWMPRPTI